MAVPLQLSNTKPDFDSLVLQLQVFLQSRSTWKDLLPSSTGQTLIEMMASIGALNQFAIENAARESFLTNAVRDSSIYAITRMLGVRIGRKLPAGTPVMLTRTNIQFPQIIQPYTQFTVNGQAFFNRDPIIFQAGQSHPTTGRIPEDNLVNMYEGTVKIQTIAATSASFTEISLNEPKFTVSDTDVVVSVLNADTGTRDIWSRIEQGIWTAGPLDKVYYDSSLGNGDTVLSFGDGYHGALPGLGNSIEVKYVVTTGSVGNNGGIDLPVACPEYPLITGVNTSAIAGGADEKPASYYKILAPSIYRARSRAVTPIDYKAIIAGYPGVASVTVQTQKDIAPNDIRWMNMVRVCILPQTQDAFSATAWQDFLAWFANYHHAAIHVQQYNPIKELVDIELVLALNSNAPAEETVAQVDARIRALFAKDITTLGRRIAVSDIIDACALKNVDYTDLVNLSITGTTGRADLVPLDKLSYFALNSLSIGAQYSERTLYNEAARRVI